MEIFATFRLIDIRNYMSIFYCGNIIGVRAQARAQVRIRVQIKFLLPGVLRVLYYNMSDKQISDKQLIDAFCKSSLR